MTTERGHYVPTANPAGANGFRAMTVRGGLARLTSRRSQVRALHRPFANALPRSGEGVEPSKRGLLVDHADHRAGVERTTVGVMRVPTTTRARVAGSPRLLLLLCAALASWLPSGPAAAASGYCHGLPVGHTGDVYSVSRVSCASARSIALRFLHRQRVPAPWRCNGRRSNTGRSEYVFVCRTSRGRSLHVYDASYAD